MPPTLRFQGRRATFVDPLGLSAAHVMNFIGGHIIYSSCAPIALVEAYRPHRVGTAWISRRALGVVAGLVVAGLYIAASALILQESLTTESSHASVSQVSGSAAGPLQPCFARRSVTVLAGGPRQRPLSTGSGPDGRVHRQLRPRRAARSGVADKRLDPLRLAPRWHVKEPDRPLWLVEARCRWPERQPSLSGCVVTAVQDAEAEVAGDRLGGWSIQEVPRVWRVWY
jgi:hypothetical protein